MAGLDSSARQVDHRAVSGQQRPLDVYRVLDDARAVRQRVQRLLQALIITADSVAEAVEEDVFAHSHWTAEYGHLAKVAREDARLYRDLHERLADRNR